MLRKSLLREILLYRYRYVAGIAVFLVVTLSLVLIRIDLAPTGLSKADMNSALASATFDFTTPLAQSMIDLPYKLLQKLSMSLFGITDFGIILPSMIMAIATAIAFIAMVNRWFRLNVALITSLIFVTSAAFLTMARTGHASIMTSFWLSLLLLAATNIIHPQGKTKLWFIAAVFIVPLSLYTPLMVYPLMAIFIAGFFHPHVRFTLSRTNKNQLIIGIVTMLLILVPLIASIALHHDRWLELLGIPATLPAMSELVSNAKFVIKSFFNLGGTAIGEIPQPLFGAASLIIIILGFLKTIQDWYSARSYMLLIWATFFIPIALFNPSQLLIALVPGYLFMAIGIETLIREWYKLFPTNPYARLAGLLPLIVLLGGIMLSNVAQYFYGYLYGTPTVHYSEQLSATREVLNRHKNQNAIITTVVKPDEVKFYDLLRRDYPRMNVTETLTGGIVRPTIVHDGAHVDTAALGIPSQIITSYKSKADQVIVRYYEPVTPAQ